MACRGRPRKHCSRRPPAARGAWAERAAGQREDVRPRKRAAGPVDRKRGRTGDMVLAYFWSRVQSHRIGPIVMDEPKKCEVGRRAPGAQEGQNPPPPTEVPAEPADSSPPHPRRRDCPSPRPWQHPRSPPPRTPPPSKPPPTARPRWRGSSTYTGTTTPGRSTGRLPSWTPSFSTRSR